MDSLSYAQAKRISVRHLRSFVTVAHLNSLTKASKMLFVTQSALSLTIQHLEEDLGLRLFDRTTRRFELTQAGEELLSSAERLIEDFDATLRDMRALGQRKRGSVAIAAVPSVLGLLLPQVTADYLAAFPGIDIELREETSRGVHARVLQGEVDAGIASMWQPNPEIEFEPLFEDHYGVLFPPGHRFEESCNPIAWTDLAAENIVGFGTDASLRQQLADMPDILKHIRKPSYVASDASAIESLVRAGLGVSVVSALSAQRPPLDRLKLKLLHEPVCFRTVGIVSRNGRSSAPAATELLDRIRAQMPKLARFEGVRIPQGGGSPA